MHEKNIYNTVMLTIVTMLYVTSLRLIYLIARSSYLYPFSAHHHLTSGKHQTIHCIFEFWFCSDVYPGVEMQDHKTLVLVF